MRPNSPKAWLLAARPKTLTAALIPVILGSALAFADQQFQTEEAVLCLLFACLMQVAGGSQLYQRPVRLSERQRPK